MYNNNYNFYTAGRAIHKTSTIQYTSNSTGIAMLRKQVKNHIIFNNG